MCAAGEAAWHAAGYAGLGARWRTESGVAWADRVPHPFLLGGVTLQPEPRLPDRLPGPLCDSWAAMTLDAGWTAHEADPWMHRNAGPFPPLPRPPALVVAPTDDAELFERVAFLGAGGRPPSRPGELHPRGSERVPGLTLLLARIDDEPVGTALAVVHARGVVVSGVAVLASARRRGIGAALTVAAAGTAAGRPATLSASAAGIGTYRRLGFSELGRPLHWTRR